MELIKQKAKELKKHTLTVYFLSRDPKLPFYIKIIAILVAAYALSPIDLIPDFIPILGLIDDIILVPLGLALVLYLSPSHIIESAQVKAQQYVERPVSYTAAIIFIIIWIILLYIFAHWFYLKYIV